MIRTHCKIELKAEAVRLKLQNIPGFNAYEAFNSLDLNSDGKVLRGEIARLIESRGFGVSELDAQMLLAKFDHDKDGVIRFNDFRIEILPKRKC